VGELYPSGYGDLEKVSSHRKRGPRKKGEREGHIKRRGGSGRKNIKIKFRGEPYRKEVCLKILSHKGRGPRGGKEVQLEWSRHKKGSRRGATGSWEKSTEGLFVGKILEGT